jgi:hypothetical protein
VRVASNFATVVVTYFPTTGGTYEVYIALARRPLLVNADRVEVENPGEFVKFFDPSGRVVLIVRKHRLVMVRLRS